MMSRLERWAEAKDTRVRGVNPYLLSVHSAQRFNDVRVTGLAAEMTYYGLISLVPLVLALGAAVGFLEWFVGAAQAAEIENAIIRGVDGIFSAEVTADVIEPLVRGLLAEARAGTALLSLLVTFLTASAVFRAVIRGLDEAYEVPERRAFLKVWGLAYLLAIVSVVVIVIGLAFVVIGPLLGGGIIIAEWLGLGEAWAAVWAWGRWPVVLVVATFYLAWVYTAGPNVRTRFWEGMPGALLASIGAILIAVGLRFYLQVAGPRAPAIGDAADAVQTASQTIGAILAVMLWIWLTAIAVLVGGLVNAEIKRQRGERVVTVA